MATHFSSHFLYTFPATSSTSLLTKLTHISAHFIIQLFLASYQQPYMGVSFVLEGFFFTGFSFFECDGIKKLLTKFLTLMVMRGRWNPGRVETKFAVDVLTCSYFSSRFFRK